MYNKVSILINTCDNYHDVLPLFFSAFQEYWPQNDFPIYLNSEHKNFEFDGLEIKLCTILKNEDANWGYRFKKALNQIESEYIITLFDDYILESNVNNDLINYSILRLDTDINTGGIYFFPFFKKEDMQKTNNDYFVKTDESVPYRINTSPAIWRKSFLKKLISKKDDPWSWEAFAHLKQVAKSSKVLSIPNNGLPAYNYAASKGGAIYRGRWVTSVVEAKFKKYKIQIDLNKRGINSKNVIQSRSLIWKIKFLVSGLRMVGLKMIFFIIGNYKKF